MVPETPTSLSKSVEFLKAPETLTALRDAFTSNWNERERQLFKAENFWENAAIRAEDLKEQATYHGNTIEGDVPQVYQDFFIYGHLPTQQMNCLAQLFQSLQDAANNGEPGRAWCHEWVYPNNRKVMHDINDSLSTVAYLKNRVAVIRNLQHESDEQPLRLYVSFLEGELDILVPAKRPKTEPLNLKLDRINQGAPERIERRRVDKIIAETPEDTPSVVVFGGNYGCGKSTWAYEFLTRHRENTLLYAFDSTIPHLSKPGYFLQRIERHLHTTLGSHRARIRSEDQQRVDNILAMLRRVRSHKKNLPLVFLIDNINSAGACFDTILKLTHGILNEPLFGITFVVTMRTPSTISKQFATHGAEVCNDAFEEMDELRAILSAYYDRVIGEPVSKGLFETILSTASSNIPLATTLIRDVALRGKDTEEKHALQEALRESGHRAVDLTLTHGAKRTDDTAIRLLRYLAILGADYPRALLPHLLNESHEEIIGLAERASPLLRLESEDKIILRPESAAEQLLSPEFSSNTELSSALQSVADQTAQVNERNLDIKHYSYHRLLSLLITLNDPAATRQILTDDWIAQKCNHMPFKLFEVAHELLHRAKCEEKSQAYDDCFYTHILRQTLIHNHSRRISAGEALTLAWNSQTSELHLDLADLSCDSRTSSIFTLFSLVERCAFLNDMTPVEPSIKTMVKFFNRSNSALKETLGKHLQDKWFRQYTTEILSDAASVNEELASELYKPILAVAKDTDDIDSIIELTQVFLNVAIDSPYIFKEKLVQFALDAVAELDKNEKEAEKNIARKLSPFEDDNDEQNEKEDTAEKISRQLDLFYGILINTDSDTRSHFAPRMLELLKQLMEQNANDSQNIQGFLNVYLVIGEWPNDMSQQLKHLLNNLVESLEKEDTLCNEFDLKLALQIMPAALHADIVASHTARKLIERLLECDILQVLELWPLTYDFYFYAAALRLAEAANNDTLNWTWTSLWEKARCESNVESALHLPNALIAEAASCLSESVCSLVVSSIRSLPLYQRQKDLLRAAFPGQPLDQEDQICCQRIVAELVPERNERECTIPNPGAFARFLSMTVEDNIVSSELLASRLPRILTDLDLFSGDDEHFVSQIACRLSVPDDRRRILDVLKDELSTSNFTELAFRVESSISDAVPFTDLFGRDPFRLEYNHFSFYLRGLSKNNLEGLESLIARIDSCQDCIYRALLIHEYVQTTGKWASPGPKKAAYEELPLSEVTEKFVEVIPHLQESDVRALEAHAGTGLKSVRVIAKALSKCPTPLSSDIVGRQVERVCNTLSTIHSYAGTPQSEDETAPRFDHSDAQAIGEFITACAETDSGLQFAHRVLQWLKGSGVWGVVGFIDALEPWLSTQKLPRHLQDELASVPDWFEERYRSAWMVRLLRCFRGTSDAYENVWSDATAWWMPVSSLPLETCGGRLSSAIELLAPNELNQEQNAQIHDFVHDLLKRAQNEDPVALANTFAELLDSSKATPWLLQDQKTVSAIFQYIVSHARKLPSQTREKVAEAIAHFMENSEGTALIIDTCSQNRKMWKSLLVAFGGITDASGDLSPKSESLISRIIASCWPGHHPVKAWFRCLKKTEGDDLYILSHSLALSIALSPAAEKWLESWRATLLHRVKKWVKKNCDAEHQEDMIKSLMFPLYLIDAMRESEEEIPQNLTVFQLSDFELIWKMFKNFPSTATRQQTVIESFQLLIKEPELLSDKETRKKAIEAIADVFSEHNWADAIATGGAEAANELPTYRERLYSLLSIAFHFKSPAILARCLEQLEAPVLLEAARGGDEEDNELVAWIAATFQLSELQSVIDEKSASANEDDPFALTPKDFKEQIGREIISGSENATAPEPYRQLPHHILDKEMKASAGSVPILNDEDSWLNQLGYVVEACLSASATPQTIPMGHWWKLARCGRLARVEPPAFFSLLFALCSSLPDSALPEEIMPELLATLRNSSTTPEFSELLGTTLPLLSLCWYNDEQPPVSLLAKMADYARTARHKLQTASA